MSISVVNNLELCYRGTVRHGRGGGGSVIAAFFLAHNYLSEQFGNYVEYGTCVAQHGASSRTLSLPFLSGQANRVSERRPTTWSCCANGMTSETFT